MAEYIEREAVLKSQQWDRLILNFDREAARGIVASQSAADVVPVVHGRWETVIDHDELWGDMEYYKCSVCGKMELRDAQTPYCPNCGAHMKDGE